MQCLLQAKLRFVMHDPGVRVEGLRGSAGDVSEYVNASMYSMNVMIAAVVKREGKEKHKIGSERLKAMKKCGGESVSECDTH